MPSLTDAQSLAVVAGTGHRPDKLGGYTNLVRLRLVTLCSTWLDEHRPLRVISGMALGFDQALAWACIDLKIPFDAYLPFPGQEDLWPQSSKSEYHAILSHARKVVHVSGERGFTAAKMHSRNHRMVDDATSMVALWNGILGGGTYECLRYAERRKRPIRNLWSDWTHPKG